MSEEPKDPKIIVDEDWKSQVQAEKEAATAKEQSPEPAAQESPEEKADAGGQQVPAASLSVLISTLAAQAMSAMGHLPDPVEGHAVVRPDLAKHYIDMISVLDEKTKGNLTPDEAGMMENVLHELRMIFVTTQRQASEKA